jgi:hypothetical protein
MILNIKEKKNQTRKKITIISTVRAAATLLINERLKNKRYKVK